MALVYYHKEILREIINKTERPATLLASVQISRIVFYTGAVTQLAYHLQIEFRALFQTFGLERLAYATEILHTLSKVYLYIPYSFFQAFLSSDEDIGRIQPHSFV